MGDGTKAVIFSVTVTALIFGGGYVWSQQRRTEALERGPGDLQSVVHVAGSTPLLVSLETIELSSEDSDETVWRATAYDARTGALVARKPEIPWTQCAPAGASHLWCVTSKGELGVVSLPNLEVRHTPEMVAGKVGQKLMDANRLEVTAGGALVSLLADGRKVQLDPEMLAVSPAPAPLAEPHRLAPPGPFSNLEVCAIGDSARQGFCRFTAGSGRSRVDSGDGYLRPDRVPVEVPQRMLLLTHSSLDEATATRELVVLDESLSPRLKLPLVTARASLERAALPAPDVLVLTFDSPANTTVCIDLAKGAERYRIRH